MSAAFGRAVVVGGSIAGLLAAAAASPSFDEVIVVDRDELPVDRSAANALRKGVGQGGQIHHLLTLGAQHIEELLPGLDDDLLAEGCRRYDPAADFGQYINGLWRMRTESDLRITCFLRPLFEWAIRRRVLALENVTAQTGAARALVGSPDGSRVAGIIVDGGHERKLVADLVVDASGRGSSAPRWMEALGYARPVEAEQRVFMAYSTFIVDLPDGVLPDGVHGVSCTASPEFPMGGAIRPCGNGLHIVTAHGFMRNYPPRDLPGVVRFLEQLPCPIVADCVKQADVVGDVSAYRMPGNRRRYWERLERRPEGFVVAGDAVASFDPLYGQGMTTAAIAATSLKSALADAGGRIDGLASKAQDAISTWTDVAFETAVLTDAVFEGAEYENLDPPTAGTQKLSRTLWELQTEDAETILAAHRATLFMDKSCLATESILRKVEEWERAGRTVRQECADPTVIPPRSEQALAL